MWWKRKKQETSSQSNVAPARATTTSSQSSFDFIGWISVLCQLEFWGELYQFPMLGPFTSIRGIPITIILLQLAAFLVTIVFRYLLYRDLAKTNTPGMPRSDAWIHLFCSIFIFGTNLTVLVWSSILGAWFVTFLAPFSIPAGALLLFVPLELLFGARHRDLPAGSLLKPKSTTWADVKTIRLFTLGAIRQRLEEARAKYHLRKFDPESGTYPRVYSLKDLVKLKMSKGEESVMVVTTDVEAKAESK